MEEIHRTPLHSTTRCEASHRPPAPSFRPTSTGTRPLGPEGSSTVLFRRRVAVIADNALVRAGFRLLVETLRKDGETFEVVADISTLEGALRLAEQGGAEVAIVGPGLGRGFEGHGAISIAARLSRIATELRVIVVGAPRNLTCVSAAKAAGVAAFLDPQAGSEGLELALLALAEGQSYFSVDEAQLGASSPSPVQCLAGRGSQLSRRERQVLHFVALGYTSKEIAIVLSLSPKTIEGYRRRVMEKLQLSSRRDVVSFAIRSGMLSGA